MTIFSKLERALSDRDAEAYIRLFHDDFVFVSHKDGTTLGKAEMSEMMKPIIGSDAFQTRNERCVYENDDILVKHSIMEFPDGSCEAVMAVHMLKEGKIIRSETGATTVQI